VKKAGIVAHLRKPVRQSELYDCLIKVVTPTAEKVQCSRKEREPWLEAERVQDEGLAPLLETRGRILVAEDNSVNQRVATRMVEKRGYRADAAGNGREAVEALMRIPYDLALMDCHMPEMDGFEATAEIRRLERVGDLPSRHTTIVAMTANALPDDEEKCLAAGMDCYLTKPVKPEQLDAVLERWVSGKRQPSVSEEQPAVDRGVLNTLRDLQVEGEPDILAEIIELFLIEAVERLAALQRALAQKDCT